MQLSTDHQARSYEAAIVPTRVALLTTCMNEETSLRLATTLPNNMPRQWGEVTFTNYKALGVLLAYMGFTDVLKLMVSVEC